MRARLIAALAVGVLLSATGSPAAVAAVPVSGAQPVGGPLLGSRGTVVQPLSGAPALPAPARLPASAWLVADLTTGQVLAAKDAHGRYLPASTLKTLTAVTLLPRLSATRMVTATDRDARVDGSRVGLVPGMRYSVAKLFTAMLCVSANDAADALAGAAGGIKATLGAMNNEAHRLQAYDTVARTPSGLDGPGESTSAYDLALIAKAGLAMPAFRRYLQVIHTSVPAPHHKHFQIYTHNRLLTTYRGDIGGKNGYTDAAEGTYVGAAHRHGHTILVTLMHANPDFWPMAQALLTWGFKAVGKVAPVGTLVDPLPAVAAPAAKVLPAGPAQLTVHRSARHVSLLELALIIVTVAVAATTTVRRVRRRRRPRLRLPRAY